MIVHTRMAALLALLVVVGAGVSASVLVSRTAFESPLSTLGLVSFGTPKDSYHAAVIGIDKDPEIRRSIIAKLGSSAHQEQETTNVTEDTQNTEDETPPVPEESIAGNVFAPNPETNALFLCGIMEREAAAPVLSTTLGSAVVPVVESEGARVISVGGGVLQMPTAPQELLSPQCVPLGAVGILRDGTFFSSGAAIVGDIAAVDGESVHLGYAFDGFPLRSRTENGKVLANDDLDECHGHMHTIVGDGGVAIETYHYHYTEEFPHTVGCFRGAPTSVVPIP